MPEVKTTTIRFPMPVFNRLTKVLNQTRIPMNEAVVMCTEAVLDMIDAAPDLPLELPYIVENGRLARQREEATQKLEALIRDAETRQRNWDNNRDAIFKAAKNEKTSPKMMAALEEADKAMKESRRKLEELRKLK